MTLENAIWLTMALVGLLTAAAAIATALQVVKPGRASPERAMSERERLLQTIFAAERMLRDEPDAHKAAALARKALTDGVPELFDDAAFARLLQQA